MRELTADLFASMDGFASGVNEPPFFGYFGDDLSVWIKENLGRGGPGSLFEPGSWGGFFLWRAVGQAQRLEKRAPAFQDKGRIRVGADADITVFDAEHIIDRATFEEPLQASAGIHFVFVNGVAVLKEGQLVDGVLPGKAARAPLS